MRPHVNAAAPHEPRPPLLIMVVEDDAELLAALREAFENAGLEILAERTFPSAHSRLRTQRVDVLLTDVRLGDYNGLQLALLARESNPEAKLIVFSGFDDPVLRRDAEALGATFLVKPVAFEQLVELTTSDAVR